MINRVVFLSWCLFGLAGVLEGGTIYSCRAKIVDEEKKTYCDIKTGGEGISIGDQVEVKNEFNFIAATGSVVKTYGEKQQSQSYALIVLNKIYKVVKTGYPVFVRNSDSADYWTTTKAPN